MNIFYLDKDPSTCAKMHVDKHCVKMILEYAQLLSTAHRFLDGTKSIRLSKTGRKQTRYVLPDDRESVLYSATHINHPSAIWCRESDSNYIWLAELLEECCNEYTYRYGKVHSCSRLSESLYLPPNKIVAGEFFAPTPAMPVDLKVMAENPVPGRKYDSLKSYHKYYIQEKVRFAQWKNRNIPDWFANAHLSISSQEYPRS